MDPTLPIFFTLILLTAALIATWVYVMLAVRDMMAYLRDHHHDRWCYLMSAPLWGQGMTPNGFRAMPYVFRAIDDEDPSVLSHKTTIKRRMLVAAGIFGAVLLIAVMIVAGVMTGILGT